MFQKKNLKKSVARQPASDGPMISVAVVKRFGSKMEKGDERSVCVCVGKGVTNIQ